jgi:DNA-binding winged helix-turn-helix (wHTH) protein
MTTTPLDEAPISLIATLAVPMSTANVGGAAIPPRFAFDNIVIDFDRLEVLEDGQVIAVQPRVFDLIRYLVEHRERVVGRDELLDQVWGSRFVSPATLNGRIRTARQALGDSGNEQRVIRTVHGRGYRFIAIPRPHHAVGAHTIGSAAAAAPPPPTPTPKPTTPRLVPGHEPKGVAVSGSAVHDWPLVGRYATIEGIQAEFAHGNLGGVLIDGVDGVGTSRVASAAAEQLVHGGIPMLTIRGLSATEPLPLAAIAHLVEPSVLDSNQQASDLARADILHRATDAIRATIDSQSRPVVVVDDAHLLDQLSAAVLASLIESRSVFALITRRRAANSAAVFDSLVDAGALRLETIEPLTTIDLDVLLYRTLPGPIETESLQRLADTSGGCPGRLRTIVRTAIAGGQLVLEDGVWRVIGPLRPATPVEWPIDGLSPDACRAAEIIALVGRIPVSTVVDICGESSVDELDAQRLLDADSCDDHLTITFVEPALATAVGESIGILRRRRLQHELACRLLATHAGDPCVLAAIVGWADEIDLDLDQAHVCDVAWRTLAGGETERALHLIDQLVGWDGPQINVLRADAAARRSQWELADRTLATVDVDELDPAARAVAATLGADLEFFRHGRHLAAIDNLWRHERQLGAHARPAGIRRMQLLAEHANTDELHHALAEQHTRNPANTMDTDRASDQIDAVDVALATVASLLLEGSFNQVVDAMRTLEQTEVLSPKQTDNALAFRCLALRHLGHLTEAADLARRRIFAPGNHRYGRLPVVATVLEFDAGRPRAASALIGALAGSSYLQRHPHLEPVIAGLSSVAALQLGDIDDAREHADRAAAGLPRVPRSMRWSVVALMAEAWAPVDESFATGLAVPAADEAAAAGATLHEAELLVASAVCDPSGERAARVIERLERLTAAFDGDLWPLMIDRVRAVGAREAATEVARHFDALGFTRLGMRSE